MLVVDDGLVEETVVVVVVVRVVKLLMASMTFAFERISSAIR